MHTFFKIAALAFVALVAGCVRSETDLLVSVEEKVSSDPFILALKQNMEHAFSCESESTLGSQEMSVYMSLYSVIGLRQAERDRTQIPTVHVIIYCHSAVVSRVYLDLNLWRGQVESFDQFKVIGPEMIDRIRFEQSDSFAWYIAEQHEVPNALPDLSTAAISTQIWKNFAAHISLMYPQPCKTPEKSAVFYSESKPMIFAGLRYQEFSSSFGCAKTGPLTPGFNFKGRFFPENGFVLPLEIASGGAYE